MSPDPSVHEDQLIAIERTHPKKHVWRRRLGCLVFLLLVLGVAAYFGRDRLRGWLEPGSLERLQQKGDELSRMSPREMLAKLREQASEMQEEWEKLADSDKMRERLEALRDDLAARREELSGAAREEWDNLIAKSEALLEKAREKKQQLPRIELDDLREKMKQLEERFGDVLGSDKPTTPTEKTTGSEARNLRPEDDKTENRDGL